MLRLGGRALPDPRRPGDCSPASGTGSPADRRTRSGRSQTSSRWRTAEIAGAERSQDEIEHSIIRPMGEPRIHFAVNCAARSCPVLWPDAYEVATLDDQLDRAVRKLVSTPEHFAVEPWGGPHEQGARLVQGRLWGGSRASARSSPPTSERPTPRCSCVIGHTDRVLRVRLDPERPGVVTGPVCTVIIPTLNEASSLPNLLDDLAACPRVERVIVSDGGSVDATCDIARSRGVTVVSGSGGPRRAAPSRSLGRPRTLVRLPACRFASGCRREVRLWTASSRGQRPRSSRTSSLVFDAPEPVFRFIEFGQRLRERLFGMPYGDQGLVVSQALFTTEWGASRTGRSWRTWGSSIGSPGDGRRRGSRSDPHDQRPSLQT